MNEVEGGGPAFYAIDIVVAAIGGLIIVSIAAFLGWL